MPQPRHATLATLALILGGVAIGTTEFVTMGLLPDIAAGVGVDIPSAGHTISAYAAGVVIGAPLLALLAATWPRKALLIGLMAAFTVGNVLSAVAPDYGLLVGVAPHRRAARTVRSSASPPSWPSTSPCAARPAAPSER